MTLGFDNIPFGSNGEEKLTRKQRFARGLPVLPSGRLRTFSLARPSRSIRVLRQGKR
jgi:hypothetical protein